MVALGLLLVRLVVGFYLSDMVHKSCSVGSGATVQKEQAVGWIRSALNRVCYGSSGRIDGTSGRALLL